MSTTSVPAILKYLSESSDYNMLDQNSESHTRAKKRRLDHLSWEEKIQRKKLKNRVAAQTSRDRKKAKMEQMEQAIQQLFTRNEELGEQCEKLRLTNERLLAENAELNLKITNKLSSHEQKTEESFCSRCCQNNQNRRDHDSLNDLRNIVECETENDTGSTGFLPNVFLRPRGSSSVTHSAAALKIVQQLRQTLLEPVPQRRNCHNREPVTNRHRENVAKTTLLKILLLCLLCPISSKLSPQTSPATANLTRVCSTISPRIWRMLSSRRVLLQLRTNQQNHRQQAAPHAILTKWWGRHQKQWNPVQVR